MACMSCSWSPQVPFFSQRSIATQVRAALGLLMLLMSLGSLGLLLLARRASTSAGQVYRDHLQPMMRLTEVTEAYSLDITVSFRMVRTGRMSPDEGSRRLREGEAKAARSWAAYRSARVGTPDIQRIEESLSRLRVLGNRMAAMYPNSVGYDELGFFGDREWLPEVLTCSKLLQRAREAEDRGAEEAIASLEGTARRTLAMGLILMAGSLALALGLGHAFASHLRRGAEGLVARLRSIANGNLEPGPSLTGDDELVRAGRELDRTVARLRQLMTDLQAQEALERAILDGAHAAIIGLDLEGRISRWNHGAEVMLGYSAEEVIGKATPLLWRLPEELETLAREVSARLGRVVAPGVEALQAAATLPGFGTECQYRARDGTLIPVFLTISQIRRPDGEQLGTMGVALDLRDVERLKEALKESEARYRRLAERLPAVVYQTRIWPDGRRTWPFISPQFEEVFGTANASWEENPDYPISKIHPDDLPEFIRLNREGSRNISPVTWEGRAFTERPGEMKWIRARSNPTLQPDGSILWDGLLEDVTELKLGEEALRRSEARAQEASRAKSAFLASMSHELRTPLSAILGYSRLMARDPLRSEDDRIQLEHILGAGEHLLSLINDVLSLAKIEAGRVELKRAPFDPGALVKELDSLFRLTALSKALVFEVEALDLPCLLEGDAPKLRQVLMNLLGNALKFTDRGFVRLKVAWAQGRLHASVEDSGPGISEAEQAGLFGAFHQTSGGQALGGTGLGLHISQVLVTVMGGDLGLVSVPGEGSRFFFDLPLPEAEAPALLPAPGRVLGLQAGEAARHVLVVDDRIENRDMLDRLLRQVGFRCSLAEHGQAALDQWRAGRPDLILMDLRMPVMDGFEAIARLRGLEAEASLARTPVIAISASVYDISAEDLIQRGFDAFLTKPISEEDLFEAMAALLPLRFRRAEGEADAPKDGDLDALAGQGAEWLGRFRDAILTGDLEAAETLLPELADRGLAEALRQHLRGYTLGAILPHLR